MSPEEISNIKNLLGNNSGLSLMERTNAIKQSIAEGAKKTADNRETVLKNTFQDNGKGTNYGVGTDGRTYSYSLNNNNRVINLKPLTAEEQRTAIKEASGGRISINPQVSNEQSLTDLFRVVSRLYDKGGNLVPDSTGISDMYPGSYMIGGWAEGLAYDNRGETSDEVFINGLAHPDLRKNTEKRNAESGWSASNIAPGEYIPTHELSHTARFTVDRIMQRWMDKQKEEARNNMHKYPADKLLQQAVSRAFGKDYELTETDSVGYQIMNDANEKYSKWVKENEEKFGTFDSLGIFDKAAKNAGFDSLEDAAASISGYAGERYQGSFVINGNRIPYDYVDKDEVFAEAYTDVLLNGEDAAKFSKELIGLFREYADTLATRTRTNRNDSFKQIQEMFSVLPKSESFAEQVERAKRAINIKGGK